MSDKPQDWLRSRPWVLYAIGSGAAATIWSGWVNLGTMCGYGPVQLLPGIADVRFNTAITLPIGVEAYGAYALSVWLDPGTPKDVKNFARWSALGALTLGMLGQISYHLLAAARAARAPGVVVVLVSCIPVITLALGAALAHMKRAGHATTVAVPASIEPSVPVAATAGTEARVLVPGVGEEGTPEPSSPATRNQNPATGQNQNPAVTPEPEPATVPEPEPASTSEPEPASAQGTGTRTARSSGGRDSRSEAELLGLARAAYREISGSRDIPAPKQAEVAKRISKSKQWVGTHWDQIKASEDAGDDAEGEAAER